LIYRLLKEFWVNSYKTDQIAFWNELFSVILTIIGSCILTFTSPHPTMHYVFPLYLLGSITLCYASYRRRQIWIVVLSGWFTIMNVIGNFKVFL
jgi:membrane protease YdiL (CAAX protease family)